MQKGSRDTPTWREDVGSRSAGARAATRRGSAIRSRGLSVLSPERVTFSKGSGRLELAQSIATHPLALRVIVNRVWKGHFGTGLVDTPSNFGINGQRPTHPELIDHLAQVFIVNKMSIKALHREIMRSVVYQLSGDHQAAAFGKDAGNRLYWRATRRRLSAEQIRDSVLMVSGALDSRIGGPASRCRRGPAAHLRPRQPLQADEFPQFRLPGPVNPPSSVSRQRRCSGCSRTAIMQQHAERLAERVAE
jgi:hypothetical protein